MYQVNRHYCWHPITAVGGRPDINKTVKGIRRGRSTCDRVITSRSAGDEKRIEWLMQQQTDEIGKPIFAWVPMEFVKNIEA